MILTFKLKHNFNLSQELLKARQVALFALKTKSRTSKDVTHIGLKSALSNQILKKYSTNEKLKKISSVKLTVPSQAIKFNNKKIIITCLKMELDFGRNVEKINQIELDETFAYVSCTVKEKEQYQCNSWIGVDLNTTGHCLVASNPKTGKVLKLGKKANHTRQKYKNIRKRLQKEGRYKEVKKLNNKESRVLRDLDHKISNKLLCEAEPQGAGVVFRLMIVHSNFPTFYDDLRCALASRHHSNFLCTCVL